MNNIIIVMMLLCIYGCAAGGASGGVVTSSETSGGKSSGTSSGNFACTGTYPNQMAACSSVTSTVSIPGGSYANPYVISTPNTEYILSGDITAAGTAIQITAAPVVINLNGHTITYNTTAAGSGIFSAAYNLNNVGISNGTIVQAPSQTTFTSAINNSQTSIPVANSATFNVGEYLIAFTSQTDQNVYVEDMLITAITGNALTVTRGYNSTTAAAHDNTAVVFSSRGLGGQSGIGQNPILTKPFGITNLQVDSVNANYSGLDTGGFWFGMDYQTVSNCTLTDSIGYGWVTQRGYGVPAIATSGAYLTAYGNTVVNTRNTGIGGGQYSNIHNNTISILSVCTNSCAIGLSSNSVMHDNNITGRGEAPIGVEVGTDNNIGNHSAARDTTNIQIYNNTMDMQVTQLGGEYGSSTYPGPTTWKQAGEWGVGIRSTTGIQNTSIYNNTITVRSNNNFQGTYSPTGETVTMGANAKGIMLGLRWNDENMNVYGNNVTALDNDGTGQASGIACDANIDNRYWYTNPAQAPLPDFHPALAIYGNTVTSNSLNLALGDDYGQCDGFPLIYQNTFTKSGDFSSYATIGEGAGAYYGPDTGILLSTIYQGGASESALDLRFGELSNSNAYRGKAVIFGRLMPGTVENTGGNPLSKIQATVYPGATSSFNVQLTTTSNSQGVAPLYVYDKELNNSGGTTGSATPTTVTFTPHTIDLYNLTTNQDMFTTTADTSSSAWDALTSSGTFTLTGTGGSITISN